ncbi:MAG: matrixin family metalloprotease [Candidatus Aquicultorales bacterium]
MRRLTRIALVALLVVAMLTTVAGGVLFARDGKAIGKITFVHFAKPAGKGGPQPPSDTNTTYKYTGLHWASSTPSIGYVVDSTNSWNLQEADIRTATAVGLSAWNAANTNVSFTDEGTTALTSFPGNATDGKNSISFAPISAIYSNAIAITYSWYYTGTKEIFEVDTIFNDDLPWSINAYGATFSGSFDYQNILTHEVGHWFVLGDLYTTKTSELTMYGYGSMGETKKDTLGAGDIRGINAIYP